MDFNTNDKDTNETNSSISSDLIRGHINTIILRTLYDGDKYGYEIINEIEEKSKGQYVLKQPTLYSALKRLESQDYITSYWGGVSNGGRRKYFQLTEKGRAVAEQNLAEWEYSRTVIDSLISERTFDFNNPAPKSVDFNLLKKSTTRVRTGKDGEDEYYEEGPIENSTESDFSNTEEPEIIIDVPTLAENAPFENDAESTENNNFTATQQDAHVQQESTYSQPVDDPVFEEEQKRIHENYKRLVGEGNDTTSYYYSNLNQEQHYQEKRQEQENYVEVDTNEEPVADAKYIENNAIASDILYSTKPPAERNYKQLLSKLYDNTQHADDNNSNTDESTFIETPQEQVHVQPTHTVNEPIQQPIYTSANTTSNIEFYDVQEKAENDGLKINTANKSRTKPEIKSIGNTYDKGKVLFTTALYVFIIALVESIVFLCLKNALSLEVAYVVLPFVFSFVMLGLFLFLYLKGYGKNSRKSQAKSFISASLILFVNLVLVICLIAYLVIVYNEITVSFAQICKFAILPCIFVFNIPLFAIFYNYNRNKE